MKKRFAGFTLIELMIAVAVVGILAAVAYPSYQQYVIKTNRAAAQSYMLSIVNIEEQYLLDARQYGETGDLTLNEPAEVSKFYEVTVSHVGGDPMTYLISAAPKAGTMQEGDGTLTLDQTGAKGPSGKW